MLAKLRRESSLFAIVQDTVYVLKMYRPIVAYRVAILQQENRTIFLNFEANGHAVIGCPSGNLNNLSLTKESMFPLSVHAACMPAGERRTNDGHVF